jgi:hypothetical protein
MKNATTEPSVPDAADDMFRRPVETPAMLLEARLEAAGRRMAVYLRHLPLPERTRHELALAALEELARDPGVNPIQAEARGMRILRALLEEQTPAIHAVPGPGVRRRHMKPEEMDRRPWVRAYLRLMRPLWIMTASFFNSDMQLP